VDGYPPVVVCNHIEWSARRLKHLTVIVISPGSGHPNESGTSLSGLGRFVDACQCSGYAWGIRESGSYSGASSSVPRNRCTAASRRYTTLVSHLRRFALAVHDSALPLAGRSHIPDELQEIAWTDADVLMGVRHRSASIWGCAVPPGTYLQRA